MLTPFHVAVQVRDIAEAREFYGRKLGFPEEMLRAWEFYFAYCEGGYAEGQLGNVQMLLARPGARVLADPS